MPQAAGGAFKRSIRRSSRRISHQFQCLKRRVEHLSTKGTNFSTQVTNVSMPQAAGGAFKRALHSSVRDYRGVSMPQAAGGAFKLDGFKLLVKPRLDVSMPQAAGGAFKPAFAKRVLPTGLVSMPQAAGGAFKLDTLHVLRMKRLFQCLKRRVEHLSYMSV